MPVDFDSQYEVVIVCYAAEETLRSKVFLNFDVYGEPDGPIGLHYYFWVIRNRARTYVVDSGFSRRGGDKRGNIFTIHPGEALSTLGVNTDEATLILTHLHYDHAGNVDSFPRSTVIAPRREYEFWTGSYARRLQFKYAVEEDDIGHLRNVDQQGRLQLHSGTTEVAPGIELIELGGHSPGQSVLVVDTSEGAVLLASDATHFYEEIDRDMPFYVVADLEQMYAGYDRLRQLVHERQAILVPGHDAAVLDRHRPWEGGLTGIAAAIGSPDPRGETDEVSWRDAEDGRTRR